MDPIKMLYLERYNEVHNGMSELLEPLSEEQIRRRPHEAVNSIAWLFWHVARAEDIALNRLVTDGVQVLDGGMWGERLNVPFRHFGVGMTGEEVAELSNRIDLGAMRAYFSTVYQRTIDVLDLLDTATLPVVVDAAELRKIVFDEGVGGAEADFVDRVWQGRTRGCFLMYMGLSHSCVHHGEAQTISSLMSTGSR